uniref:Uncharacterized protein n=1 Tax=Pithovirus LCPAC202 TaxID=2506592 RepID=A0A481Z749_9VIRU|nr:MAG: hypothetical protein LCPAC202_03290 [Pithovirus LCPAC202]
MTSAFEDYAVTTQDQMSWLTTGSNNSWDRKSKKSKPTKKSKSKSAPKVLLYKSLLEGAKYISDPEWQEIVKNAAYGEFPVGFSTRKEGIVYSYSDKKISVNPSIDPYEAVIQTIDFMRAIGGIKTTMDLEKSRQEFDDIVKQAEDNFNNQKWKDLKAKAKKSAIGKFIDRMAMDHKFTGEERKVLQTIINVGLTNGAIKGTEINYYCGAINNINGLVFDQKMGRFKLTDEILAKVKMPSQKGFQSDYIYFSLYNQPPRNKKFKGFVEEWIKYKKTFDQQQTKTRKTYTSTLRGTERAVVPVSSLEYENAKQSLDSLRSYSENYPPNSPMIESEGQTRINPNNLLLSPRTELPLRLIPKQIPKKKTPKLVLIIN